ncbi:hypothetical protein [Shewanella sp. TC10]|uniref:hypothetical protein n=1 Tax=Shewanella sp. TC10 TaxID=1419739 RepID=UPI00129D655C|nr:hypothetical protein [Shewanella sp. TC10]
MSKEVLSESIPEVQLDIEAKKRPALISIVCILHFVGGLISLPIIFTDSATIVGAWYPYFLAIATLIGLATFIGLWMMKRLAAYAYIFYALVNQFVLIYTGVWVVATLVMPVLMVVLIAVYFKRLK